MFLKLNITSKYVWGKIPRAKFNFLKNLNEPYPTQWTGEPYKGICYSILKTKLLGSALYMWKELSWYAGEEDTLKGISHSKD